MRVWEIRLVGKELRITEKWQMTVKFEGKIGGTEYPGTILNVDNSLDDRLGVELYGVIRPSSHKEAEDNMEKIGEHDYSLVLAAEDPMSVLFAFLKESQVAWRIDFDKRLKKPSWKVSFENRKKNK